MSKELHKATTNSGDENANQFRVQTIWIALRCWWKVTAPLGLLFAVGAAAGMYYYSKPVYTAATWLTIRDRPHVLLGEVSPGDQKKFVENQMELLKSPRVLEQVASIPAVASTPEIVKFGRDPAQALRKLLKIKSLGRSDYFVIEFTSIDREKAALITNKVSEAYIELQRSNQHEVKSLTIGLLEKEQAAQQVLVERYRANVRDLTKQLTGSEAFPLGPNQGRVEIRTAASELESKLMAAEVDQVVLKAQLDAESKLLQANVKESSAAEIDLQIESIESVVVLRRKIEGAKARMREYERVSINVDKNTAYQHLKSDVKADEQSLAKLRTESREKVTAHLETTARAQRETQIQALQQRLANAEFTATVLREKLDRENAGRKTEKGESLELEFVRADYLRASKVYEAIADRILQMRMEQRAPNQVEQFQAAKPPASPDGEMPYKKMVIVAFGAFMFPFASTVALEHFYRRVSCRNQLENVGGILVVGEVTSLPHRSRKRNRKDSHSQELQLFEESIDGLRTYLTLVHSLKGMQVLAVTSAVSREGKTSLAAQLAISLASATGERTLLIDGDTRSPDIHRAFDIDLGPGFVEVLKGSCSLEDAIETGFSDSLHILTAGCLDSSPHRLLGSSEFDALLNKLKSSYRHIVIDTPPLLPASESLLLARAADAVVLCVRRDFSRVDQSVEAYARLRSAGAKVAGAVLNGIPARSYVSRYGSYYMDPQQNPNALPEEVAS